MHTVTRTLYTIIRHRGCDLALQAAEERERMIQMEIDRQQKAVPRFETAQEREERLKREKEQEQFGEVAVTFTLTTPHPDYTYYTDLPHTHSQRTQSEPQSPGIGTGNTVPANQSTAGSGTALNKDEVINTKALSPVLARQRSKVNGNSEVLHPQESVVGRKENRGGAFQEGHVSVLTRGTKTLESTVSALGVKEPHKSHGKGRNSPSVMSNGMRGGRGERRGSSKRRASGQANFIAGSTVTVQLSSCEGHNYLTDVC